MFITSDIPDLSPDEILSFFSESATDKPNSLKTNIIDPMINKFKDTGVKKSYIDLANEFIDLNADMLAKQYPTATVVFPRLYVDNVLGVFG